MIGDKTQVWEVYYTKSEFVIGGVEQKTPSAFAINLLMDAAGFCLGQVG